MLSLTHRSLQKELLDGENIPFGDIVTNMKELNFINTYLGGHAITINGFKQLIGKQKVIIVLEVGCGGGDNLVAVKKWCDKNSVQVNLIGIDINTEVITFAKQQHHEINIICEDYRKVSFDAKPDIIFSSLFCHHFSNDELLLQIQWMKENSKLGFFINDLHRHSLAFLSIKWLTYLFSNSYLVKHDAPLSVARGFKKHEWLKLFEQAGVRDYSISWKWAFRHLIVFKHHERA